ncbi:hypothetical protein M5689_019112 [Euphorbia peplus]|nr:hypothetical protein M5689_019112 [Euphorbia peplus]
MEKPNQQFEPLFEQQRQLDQKMERFWNQPYSHQQWKLLLKEQENSSEMFHKQHQKSLQRLRNYIAFLAQVLLEKQGVPNPSHVASQLFDIIFESKEDETLSTTLQVFDEMTQKNLGSLDKQNMSFDEKRRPEQKLELAGFSSQSLMQDLLLHPKCLMKGLNRNWLCKEKLSRSLSNKQLLWKLSSFHRKRLTVEFDLCL